MPIIPNDPTSNVEYVPGGAYYIRTKSKPHLYWFFKNQKMESILIPEEQPSSKSIEITQQNLHQQMIVEFLKEKTMSNLLHCTHMEATPRCLE
jgi:hypothetical protein